MVKYKIINAWGIKNNSSNVNQSGGNYPYNYPFSPPILYPYMLLNFKNKIFDFETPDFKENIKNIIKWNYQYKIYKLLFEDMENQRRYMAKVNWSNPRRPVYVYNLLQ